ncbi:LysR family transcriptional regulator [Alteromonas sp. a30]|uniref:LysR family transcriptional regulator n=1 Tax=Alteromonas sp. a30 TaxID=2730917 RepID=UPI00227EAC19|nr:LysR family transcriptional regulator [Alteromonas sp. a30]MCY7295582.1 LysR family transcriptional regulator [Alteromonas sp. a30]
MQQLDLNLLKIFESLYQQRNMTQTAQVLNLTPSAVSHAVKRLRESLNDPLFVRQGSKMQPTPACRRLAPQLLAHLHQLRQTLQQFTHFEPANTEQTFHIAIHRALEPLIAPVVFREGRMAAPKANWVFMGLDRQQVKRQMTAGQIDFAIDIAQPLGAPFLHQPLFSDPLCVMFDPAQQPWQADAFSQSVYLAAEHIAVSNRPTGIVMEDFELQQQGFVRHIALRCQTYLAATQMLQQTSLLLTLPQGMAQDYLLNEQRHEANSTSLAVLPLPFATQPIETHLYWHENAEHDASLKWLKDVLVGCLNMRL